MKPIRLNHIKTIPLEFNLGTEHQPLANHIKDELKPQQMKEPCSLYNFDKTNHCKTMGCNSYTAWFCYTPKKKVDYTL